MQAKFNKAIFDAWPWNNLTKVSALMIISSYITPC